MWLKKLYSIITLIIYPIYYKNIPVPFNRCEKKEERVKKIVWELKDSREKSESRFW